MRSSSRSISQLIKDRTDGGVRIVTFLCEVMDGVHHAPAAVRVKAAEMLAERCWGKAPQINLEANLADLRTGLTANSEALTDLVDLLNE